MLKRAIDIAHQLEDKYRRPQNVTEIQSYRGNGRFNFALAISMKRSKQAEAKSENKQCFGQNNLISPLAVELAIQRNQENDGATGDTNS